MGSQQSIQPRWQRLGQSITWKSVACHSRYGCTRSSGRKAPYSPDSTRNRPANAPPPPPPARARRLSTVHGSPRAPTNRLARSTCGKRRGACVGRRTLHELQRVVVEVFPHQATVRIAVCVMIEQPQNVYSD